MPEILFKKGIAPYIQIQAYLNEKIESGIWPIGYQIPPESKLVEMFGVSRMTIRRAISELVNAGKLEARQGSGTFVAEPRLTEDFTNLYFPNYLGHKHLVLERAEIPAEGQIAQLLRLPAGEPLYHFTRLRMFNDIPGACEESFLQKSRFPGLEQADLSQRLQILLRDQYNLHLTHVETIIEPVIPDENKLRLLQLSNHAPCLLLHRVSFSYQQDPVMYSTNIIRGDKCRLKINSSHHSSGI